MRRLLAVEEAARENGIRKSTADEHRGRQLGDSELANELRLGGGWAVGECPGAVVHLQPSYGGVRTESRRRPYLRGQVRTDCRRLGTKSLLGRHGLRGTLRLLPGWVGAWDGVEEGQGRALRERSPPRVLPRSRGRFLNHGSLGACRLPAFEQYRAWRREREREPVDFLGRRLPGLLHGSRVALGAAGGQLLRLSVAAYPTRGEIDRLLAALVRELDAEHGQEDE
jgi:hypothetical protein